LQACTSIKLVPIHMRALHELDAANKLQDTNELQAAGCEYANGPMSQ